MKINKRERDSKTLPQINVTPMIDILLVLLILFMVITPLKPTRFEAQVPREPQPENEMTQPPPLALVVTISKDLKLKLNGPSDMGTVDNTEKLSAELAKIFTEREENRVYAIDTQTGQIGENRIEKTVFIKASRSIEYGEVVKVIDGVKGAGAYPIGLQIDDLTP